MSTPKIADRLPGKQSLKKHLFDNILNSEDVRAFGPKGASTRTHGLTKPDKPCGDKALPHEWGEMDAAEIPKVRG